MNGELRMFPVLWQGDRGYMRKLAVLGCPREVPWEFIAEHRQGCLDNHDQTPERLAERGGLAPAEIVAVIEAHGNWDQRKKAWAMTPEQEVTRLCELLAEYGRRTSGTTE